MAKELVGFDAQAVSAKVIATVEESTKNLLIFFSALF